MVLAQKLIEKRTPRPADTANFKQAASEAEHAVQMDPRCAEAHALLAYAQFRLKYIPCLTGVYAEAEGSARRAIEFAADNSTKAAAQRTLGRVAAANRQWAEATHILQLSIQTGGANSDGQLWLDDLEMIGVLRPIFLSSAVKILRGEKLEEASVNELTARESFWLLNAVLARNGRQLNLAVQDWLFYCPDSPLGKEMGGNMPTVMQGAVRNPVKGGTVDWENTQLLAARRKAAKGGGTPALGNEFAEPGNKVGAARNADPFEVQGGGAYPGSAASGDSEPVDLLGAWSGPLKGGGQIKLVVDDVSDRLVQATLTSMSSEGDFDTLKVSGSLNGKSLALRAENGSRLSVKYKSGKGGGILAGNWTTGTGQKLSWIGRKQ